MAEKIRDRKAPPVEPDPRETVKSKNWQPLEDQIGVLWGRKSKSGGFILQGHIDSDSGEVPVIGIPFVTRMFRSGLTLCLARHYDSQGNSVRADGDVKMAEKPKRKRKAKDA